LNVNNQPNQQDQKWSRHVMECLKGDRLFRAGDKAEKDVVEFLLDNLSTDTVGDYRILMNYHMPFFNERGLDQFQEIDIVLINKFGIYVLEVKDWIGRIIVSDETWMKNNHDMGNPYRLINSKAKNFKGKLKGISSDFKMVWVRGVVVLAQGKNLFETQSRLSYNDVVGIDDALLNIVSPPPDFYVKRKLKNEEILQIRDRIAKKHSSSSTILVEDYRLENELLPGGIYKAYEAKNVNLPNQRVRIKIYQSDARKEVMDRIRRDADAVTKLGHHPNILYTINFIPDAENPNLYYEITELIKGRRLDKKMARQDRPLPFELQINYLEQLCRALSLAHRERIFHRNICPETVYVTDDGIVKLADFDFAKMEGFATIVDTSIPIVTSDYTPPELKHNASNASAQSDLYSLGCLWLYMASWPADELPKESVQALPISQPARDLMQTLISPEPVDRPQTANDLLKELNHFR
jgi:serine/threonine-protein kinase